MTYRLRRALLRNPTLLAVPVILAVVLVVFATTADAFWSTTNLRNILLQSAVTAIVAVGMTFTIVTAGMDMSVGSMLFLGGVVIALAGRAGLPFAAAALLAVLVTTACGALNGVLIGALRLNPLIVTIATFALFRGLGEHLTGAQVVLADSTDYKRLATGFVLGLPTPVWIMASVAVLGWFGYRFTRYGRYLRAVGSNEVGARESAMKVRSLLTATYAITGVLVGMAAPITVGRLGSVDTAVGEGFELTVITAVVLGGTALTGGYGSIWGSVLGAVLLATIENGLVLVGASVYWYDIIRALILAGAVALAAAGGNLPRLLARRREPSGPPISPRRAAQPV